MHASFKFSTFLVYSLVSLVQCYRMFQHAMASARSSNNIALSLQTKANIYPYMPAEQYPLYIPSVSADMKLGVLLLNLGGPESQEDVEGFLFNLFADPDIIRLPSIISALQKPIAYVIAKRRAPKSSEAYRSIGGGSPIVKYTREQAGLIQNGLIERGFDAKCYFAMRYWNPYTEEVLEQMHKDGVNTLVVVPLYPQYSISTSGSSLKLLQEIFVKNPQEWGPEKVAVTVVPSWYHRKGYVRCMAGLIMEELVHYTAEEMNSPAGVHILFSAHGVPESYIEAGDPYKRQIEECILLITREVARMLLDDSTRPASISREQAYSLMGRQAPTRGALQSGNVAVSDFDIASIYQNFANIFQGKGLLKGQNMEKESNLSAGRRTGDSKREGELQFHLSFQSRVGPVQWLRPYTEEVLEGLGESGVKNLIVVPVSFVSEHVETLEEIDIEYRELAEEHGVTKWRRVPAVNTDPRFIADMVDLVVEALETPSLSLSETIQNFDIMDQSSQQTTAMGAAIGLQRLLQGYEEKATHIK